VLVPAESPRLFPVRFRQRVAGLLNRIGVPNNAIEAELRRMHSVAYAPIVGRDTVLHLNNAVSKMRKGRGILDDYLEKYEDGGSDSAAPWAGMRAPRDTVTELFSQEFEQRRTVSSTPNGFVHGGDRFAGEQQLTTCKRVRR